MTKRRTILAILLGLLMTLCLSFAVACGDSGNEGDGGSTAIIKWTINDEEHVSVTVDDKTELPKTFTVGETLTFKVTPDQGYEVVVKNGRATLNEKDGAYSFMVKKGTNEITITASKQVTGVTVSTKPSKMVYYAGEELDKTGMVVTVNYATGDSEPVTVYSVNYQHEDAVSFMLGDTSFTVTYGTTTSAPVQLDQTVVGKVTIDPQGGTINESYATELEKNTEIDNITTDPTTKALTFTFKAALTAPITLPAGELVTRGEEGDYTFLSWEGATAGYLIPAELATSATYKARWNAKLLTLEKVYYELGTVEGEKAPLLVVEGKFRAARSAYLYLYEGKAQVEMKGPEVKGENRGDPFRMTFDMSALADKTYLGKWMDIKFVAESGDGIKDTQEINLAEYQDVEGFYDPDDQVAYGGFRYSFKEYSDGTSKTLKAVANEFIDMEYTMSAEGNGTATPKLKLDVTVKDEKFHGKVAVVDFYVGGTLAVRAPIGADGKFSVTFDLSQWQLGAIAYGHFSIIESENDSTKLFPLIGDEHGEYKLPNSGCSETNLTDNGGKAPDGNNGNLLSGKTLRIANTDETRVFYFGPGMWDGIIGYGYNEKASIEAVDFDVALKVDNFTTPTKVYYVFRVKLGGKTPYTKEELVEHLMFGNVDGSTLDKYMLESVDMVKEVEGGEGVYDLWYDVTSYAGGQLWPNVYWIASKEATPVASDMLFQIKDNDHSTDGLFAIVNGTKYTVRSGSGEPYWDCPCFVPAGAPEEGETNPEVVDPNYVPPAKSYTVDMSTLKLELKDGKPTLSIGGTVTGYTKNEITFDLQTNGVGTVHSSGGWQYVENLSFSVTVGADGKFTITVDLSNVGLHKEANNNGVTQYLMHIKFVGVKEAVDVKWADVKPDENGDHVTYNNLHYTLIIRNAQTWDGSYVQLVVSESELEEPSVQPQKSYKVDMSTLKLELKDGKPTLSIGGTVTGYTKDEITFDLQTNGVGTVHSSGGWQYVENLSFSVTVGADGKFTITVDLSNVGLHKEANNNGVTQYLMHIKFVGVKEAVDVKWADVKPDENGDHVTYNNLHYTLIIRNAQTWDGSYVQLVVSESELEEPSVQPQKSYKVDMSTLKLELKDGKPTLSIGGTVTGYTKDEITFDLQTNGEVHKKGGWDTKKLTATVTVGADGKFTVTVDLSNVGLHDEANNDGVTQYLMHLYFGEGKFDVEWTGDSAKTDENGDHVTYNNLHYTIIIRTGETWSRSCVQLAVSQSELEDPNA